jgi:uncharacterized caspase-like protein
LKRLNAWLLPRAPMFQVQGDGEISYHENQTVETAVQIIEALRQKALQGRERIHERTYSAAPS